MAQKIDLKEAIECAYVAYADMLYRIALSYTHCPWDAQDVIQDVFSSYIKHYPLQLNEAEERAWFIRATLNKCHDLYRKKSYRAYIPLEDVEELLPDESSLDQAMEFKQIMDELAEIPEKNRKVLILHYLEEYSVEEISHLLRISNSAVKMRLKRGREQLKTVKSKFRKGDEYV